MPATEGDRIALADGRRPLMIARPRRYVAYQIGGLCQVLPVFILLSLELVKLRLVERPLAVAKSLEELHVVFEKSHGFNLSKPLSRPIKVQLLRDC